MDGLEALLTTSIDLPLLGTLWKWMADAAGYPDDDEFTVGALVALVAAFPCTIVYKLIEGVDNEPFPSGALPFGQAQPMALLGAMPHNCLVAAALLQMGYVIPAVISDSMGSASPVWMTVLTMALSAIIFVLSSGIPDLSTVEWVGAGVVAANLLWIVPTVWFVFQALEKQVQDMLTQAAGDVMAVLSSVYGFGKMILGAVNDYLNKPDMDVVVANVQLPLPNVFGFLGMSTFTKDPLVAPFASICKIVFDLIGYFGGGAAELLEATELSGQA